MDSELLIRCAGKLAAAAQMRPPVGGRLRPPPVRRLYLRLDLTAAPRCHQLPPFEASND